MTASRKIVLTQRPEGEPVESDFALVDSELKIKKTIANEPKLKALLPPLEAKEKELLKAYLSQLPKETKQTQAAK